MATTSEESILITWVSGITTIRHEERIEDDAIVFGSVIDGTWHPNLRMSFGGNQALKAEALSALATMTSRTR